MKAVFVKCKVCRYAKIFTAKERKEWSLRKPLGACVLNPNWIMINDYEHYCAHGIEANK